MENTIRTTKKERILPKKFKLRLTLTPLSKYEEEKINSNFKISSNNTKLYSKSPNERPLSESKKKSLKPHLFIQMQNLKEKQKSMKN